MPPPNPNDDAFLRRVSSLSSGLEQNNSMPLDNVVVAMTTINEQVLFNASQLQGQVVRAIVSSSFFCVFLACAAISIYVLIRNGRITTPRVALLLVIAILFTCTTMYWALSFSIVLADSSAVFSSSKQIASALYCIGSNPSNPQTCFETDFSVFDTLDVLSLKYCAGTAALTINVVIGDAIVWWRACVVWHDRRFVRIVGALFLVATLVMGAISTSHSCSNLNYDKLVQQVLSNNDGALPIVTTTGSLFEGDKFGIAASVLSLATNVAATSLIGYKAWEHRRMIQKYLKSISGRSQVERVLTLFVESGAVYCIIWIFVVTYQSMYVTTDEQILQSQSSRSFMLGWQKFVEGALITVIATYPILIIILVSLDKSHCDNGFSYDSGGRLGSPPVVVDSLVFRSNGTTDTTAIPRSDRVSDTESLADDHVEMISKGNLVEQWYPSAEASEATLNT